MLNRLVDDLHSKLAHQSLGHLESVFEKIIMRVLDENGCAAEYRKSDYKWLINYIELKIFSSMLPLLDKNGKDILEKLSNEPRGSIKWENFWNQSIPNFTDIATNNMADVVVQLRSILETGNKSVEKPIIDPRQRELLNEFINPMQYILKSEDALLEMLEEAIYITIMSISGVIFFLIKDVSVKETFLSSVYFLFGYTFVYHFIIKLFFKRRIKKSSNNLDDVKNTYHSYLVDVLKLTVATLLGIPLVLIITLIVWIFG